MFGGRMGPGRNVLLAMTAVAVALAVACSGGSGAAAGASKAPAKAATTAAADAAAPSGDSAPGATDADKEQAALIARGKVIFQQTAGGVGCQLCHGMEARGDGAANMGAPNMRGADISRIRGALQGGVPAMQFIKLTEDELQAVAAFVKSLGGQ